MAELLVFDKAHHWDKLTAGPSVLIGYLYTTYTVLQPRNRYLFLQASNTYTTKKPKNRYEVLDAYYPSAES
jgi:hypothetical protein